MFLGQHWFKWWLVAGSAPNHYLNLCWLIVNWTLRNKLQGNSNRNTKLFISENAFENVVCEMAAILSRGRWVNKSSPINSFYGISYKMFSLTQSWFDRSKDQSDYLSLGQEGGIIIFDIFRKWKLCILCTHGVWYWMFSCALREVSRLL